ncbi:TPA: 50S ribosomal protein L13 [Candidatus Woesearchaeota archaeon]|nr:50S ribosomal protein L13 [Candidatus Woesearchaeota archaeon]
MKIYNGEGMVLGRLATHVAKDALLGEEVVVVNSEKVVISGAKINTFEKELQRLNRRGYPLKSAKRTRIPERFVRRSIRGMLPWKIARGKEAFKRIMCYRGVPDVIKDKEFITVESASTKKLPNLKYVTILEVCKYMGGKKL